jgi:hypothetical protein
MPFVVVHHVFHDHFAGIEFSFGGLPGRSVFTSGICKSTVLCLDQHRLILDGRKQTACEQDYKQEAERRKTKNRHVREVCCHEITYKSLIIAKIENNIELGKSQFVTSQQFIRLNALMKWKITTFELF